MAGRRTTTRVGAAIPSNSLVASAVSYPGAGKNALNVYRTMEGWQREAWRQFSICPELSFAANWIGNALSRCEIVPGKIGVDGNVDADDDPQVAAALIALFGGTQGQSEMLHTAGLHLSVAGEFYLVGRQNGAALLWEIIGCDSISYSGTSWSITYGETNTSAVQLTAQDTVIRIWRPDPVRRYAAWSSVKALLPVLRELEFLTRHIFAQTTSRLAGSGILALPASLEFPNSEGSANKAVGFSKELTKAMMTPLEKPDDPGSVVPFVITVPDETLQYMKEPIHFWSPFDAASMEAREKAIMRFCIGMDIPVEVILGMTRGTSSSGGAGTGASHWTAWQIEEAAIKLHIEPLLTLLCNTLTLEYIRPVLNSTVAAVTYDTKALKLQPDRSKEAFELFGVGEISPESLLTYSGMNPSDAPTDQDRKNFQLRKIAGASATPDQIAWALNLLGMSGAPDGAGLQAQHPGSNQDAPSSEDYPTRPGPPDGYNARLVLALSEPLVLRALERVGNRMRNDGIKPECPAQETHCYAVVNGSAQKYLEGCWTMVAQVAEGLVDPEKLTRVLNAYVENLLTEQVPHDRARLERYLSLVAA